MFKYFGVKLIMNVFFMLFIFVSGNIVACIVQYCGVTEWNNRWKKN